MHMELLKAFVRVWKLRRFCHLKIREVWKLESIFNFWLKGLREGDELREVYFRSTFVSVINLKRLN